MNLICSIDLELNQPSGLIIQLGGVIGDLDTGQIVEEFDYLVQINEPLNPFIVELCGITDEMLAKDGMSLQEAYQKLCDLKQRHQFNRNPITWGGGDSVELRKQLGLDENNYLFGRRWFDIKTIYQCWRMSQNQKRQAGLARAMSKSGMEFKGRKHNAKDDALNTFRFFCFLLKKFRA